MVPFRIFVWSLATERVDADVMVLISSVSVLFYVAMHPISLGEVMLYVSSTVEAGGNS